MSIQMPVEPGFYLVSTKPTGMSDEEKRILEIGGMAPFQRCYLHGLEGRNCGECSPTKHVRVLARLEPVEIRNPEPAD